MLLDFHSEIYSWIRGGLFVLFLYNFLIYFQNKNKLYLYYSLYLLAFTIYLTKHVASQAFMPFFNYLNFAIQFFAYSAYLSFARELLDTRKLLAKWDRFFVIGNKSLIFIGLFFIFIQATMGYEFQEKVFTILAPILTLFALFVYYQVVTTIKDVFSTYFIIGSLVYVIFANISFLEIIVGPEMFINNGVQPMFFVYLGTFLQCIIFSIIIGFIYNRLEQKSTNAEIRLVNKLKEIEELKMITLQSQMNPHFLFNSLNSINNFVLKNEVEKASDYITKFSKLIRAILNSSSTPVSFLSEELEILALYVKMEQMRITGGFNYNVIIDESLVLDEIKVPPMFLQPFIENSIWHGIMKKEGDKSINLTLLTENDMVLCTIVDNGIGINKSQELQISQKKKFYGTKTTEDRIKMLYQNSAVSINIEDICEGETTGTKVTIKFPIK
ncbi:sensor histidine kinase [Lutibacter sp.]|uniref:sensor histidine kinase n=1 Tax=Lutibacter sp. TaxID=1925666 RepID=UPI002733ED53|nr:histidine kinase [Lutibacter sp.]MDP3313915.1 histidine kinase [Lutibacter sp.]